MRNVANAVIYNTTMKLSADTRIDLISYPLYIKILSRLNIILDNTTIVTAIVIDIMKLNIFFLSYSFYLDNRSKSCPFWIAKYVSLIHRNIFIFIKPVCTSHINVTKHDIDIMTNT